MTGIASVSGNIQDTLSGGVVISVSVGKHRRLTLSGPCVPRLSTMKNIPRLFLCRQAKVACLRQFALA